MTIGTDLEIIPPASPVIAGADAERLPSLHTNAATDHELLAVWVRSHAGSSPHTRRVWPDRAPLPSGSRRDRRGPAAAHDR